MIDEIDPFQRGSLIHDVQFELVRAPSRRGPVAGPPRQSRIGRGSCSNAITEVAALQQTTFLQPIRSRLGGRRRCDPRRSSRVANGGRAMTTRVRAVAFRAVVWTGASLRTPASRSSFGAGAVGLDCGIQLRGSIDLVERHPYGLRGSPITRPARADGTASQVIDGGRLSSPCSMLSPRKSSSPAKARVTEGRLYFCTSTGGFAEQVSLSTSGRAAAVQVAEANRDAIRPFLPAAPQRAVRTLRLSASSAAPTRSAGGA